MSKQINDVKHVSDIIGEWGKWQFMFTTYTFILGAVGALNNMGYGFHAYGNDYWCMDVPPNYSNKTNVMKCFKFTEPNEPCTEWQYDRTEFKTSITTEFNLVCDRAIYGTYSQTAFMLGYLLSGLIFSHYSDKYGRRPVVWVAFTFEIVGILACVISPNIYLYSFARFLVACGGTGRGNAIFVTLMEICGPKYRDTIVVLSGIGWVVGYAIVPGLAYWLQDYRYMQLVSVVVLVLMVFWYYYMFESPRWLITNGYVDRAEHTLRKALKMNGKSDENLKQKLTELSDYLREVQSSESKNISVLNILKTPKLRKITLIIWYIIIVISLLYYGLSFNMADYGGNFYITFLLSGLAELPAQLLTALFMRLITRRKLFFILMALTGTSSLAVIPSRSEWFNVACALISKFGVTSAWNVMAIMGHELYPTVLRHRGMGAAYVVGRIGAICGPFMKNLTATYGLAVVLVMYANLSFIAAILALFMPETKGQEIPDTIEEAEHGHLKRIKVQFN